MLTENKYIPLNKSWYVYTEPIIEPITVDDLKVFARIDGEDEDSLLSTIITSVRKSTELYLGRSLIEQTFRLNMDYWPGMIVELPFAPLRSIEKVYVVNEDGIETEYNSSNYYAVTSTTPGKLVIKDGVTMPQNTDRYTAGFGIEYKAGYGTLSTDIPDAISNAIKMWATILYETRAITTEIPENVKFNLDLYKVMKI